MPFQPTLQSRYTVTLQGVPTYWETCSGLKDSSSTDDYNDGISNRTYKIVGQKELDDITLGKAFDPLTDKGIVTWYRNWCNGDNAPVTISITPIRACAKPEKIGPTLILYGVEPISLEGFSVDRKSTTVSRLELVLIAADWGYS